MRKRNSRISSRLLASALCGALIAAPGAGVPEALAQVKQISVQAPMRGSSPVQLGVTSRASSSSRRALSRSALGPTLKAAAAPKARAAARSAAPIPDANFRMPDRVLLETALASDETSAPGAPARPNSEQSPILHYDGPGVIVPASSARYRRARIDAEASALRKFMDGKNAEALPQDSGARSAPAAALTAPAPAAPQAAPEPAKPEGEKKPRSWLGLGAMAVLFIGITLLQSIGYEIREAAFPEYLSKIFGDFSLFAELGITARITGFVGRLVAPKLIKKLGHKFVFVAGSTIRLIAFSSMIAWALASPATFAFPIMIAFIALDGLGNGLAITAENSLPAELLGKDDTEKLDSFDAWKQMVVEIFASILPALTGVAIKGIGFTAPLLAFPVLMAVSIALAVLLLKLPKVLDSVVSRLKSLLKKGGSAEGAAAKVPEDPRSAWTIVMGNPLLRTAFFAYLAVLIINPLLYGMMAPGFGAYLAATMAGAEGVSTIVYGLITGLFSFGGLLASVVILRELRWVKNQGKKPEPPKDTWWRRLGARLAKLAGWLPALLGAAGAAVPFFTAVPLLGPGLASALLTLAGVTAGKVLLDVFRRAPAPPSDKPWTPEQTKEYYRQSMLKWIKWTAYGLAAVASFALPLPGWAAVILPSILLVPYGIAQVVAMIKVKNFFIKNAPEGGVVKAIGFLGYASLAVIVLAMTAVKFMFTGKLVFVPGHLFAGFAGLAGLAPFAVIAAAMIPMFLLYQALRKRLDTLSAPGAGDAQKP